MAFINSLPNALNLGLIWGIMAIGLFLTFKILHFSDLTVDGSFATGGAVCAILINVGVNAWLALFIAFLAGAVAGIITAVIHCYLGVPDILAGILTQFILWSINLLILGKANMALPINSYRIVSIAEPYIAIGILIGFVAVIIIGLYWFFGTECGAAIRATGANKKMAKANGINIKADTIITLALSNAIVALAGGLLCQYNGFGDIKMGAGAIVIGLAAITIGGAIFGRIHNFAVQLGGTVVGSIIYYIIFQAIVSAGVDSDLLKGLSAIIVIIFLAVPYFVKKRKEKHLYVKAHKFN